MVKINKKLNDRTNGENLKKIVNLNSTYNFCLYKVKINVNKLLSTLTTVYGENGKLKFVY